MDRVTQRHKQSNQVIGQRYLLQTELFSNSAGTLYQARDMRATNTATAAVLIHIFPNKALPQTPLKLMTERLQTLSATTNAAVLKVIDSGWFNSDAYFVLTSPPSWSLSALPPMLGKMTRIHEQALRLNQHLTEQGLITGALPTSLFLVSANGEVYLPSTALVPNLQTLTESPELLIKAHLLPKRSSLTALPWIGVGFISVATASGLGLYYQNYLRISHEMRQASSAAVNTGSLFEATDHLELPIADTLSDTASLADKPEQPSTEEKIESTSPAQTKTVAIELEPEPFSLTPPPTQVLDKESQPVLMDAIPTSAPLDPTPGDMRVALAKQSKSLAANPESQPPKDDDLSIQDKKSNPNHAEPIKAVTKIQPQAEFEEETDPTVNLPSPHTPLIQATVDTQVPKAQFATSSVAPAALAIVPAPKPAAVANTAPVLGVVNPVVTAPTARIKAPEEIRDPEVIKANGMSSDELVKKAYQALEAGRLDEQANRGTIYFIRLLERIDHGNPQIIRLARETSYQLHQQVRTALIQGNSEQASQKLWRAGRIIKEFNLVHLNPAQELLEHKLAE